MRYRFLRFPEGKPKAVTFSYDDGCRADIRLSKLFSKYGLKSTFNINSSWYGQSKSDWHLSIKEIKKYIVSQGHEIAIHGAEHKANGNVTTVEGILDVATCRLSLEKEFDTIVRGMAYPDTGIIKFHNGTTYQDVKAYLIALDIAYARTLGSKNVSFDLPADWHSWLPTSHHDDPEVLDLIDEFINLNLTDTSLAHRAPKLFYLWGHSFEFDRKNNWERIEEICEKISQKDDIWYATNIEIYEYVKAYHSLIFSADGSRIYNPTVKHIWLEIDGVSYSIKPNETIKI